MNPLERFSRACIVPVVVLDNVEDAVPTAKALLAGGIDVMEITFRTAAAKDSIAAVASACPDMLVGAGTVINLEQCKAAVSAGAGFIVSPGFDEEIIKYCIKTGITVTPGCVAPSEIMSAVKLFEGEIKSCLEKITYLSGGFNIFTVDSQMCKFKAERILTGFPAESRNLIKIAICNVFAGTNPAAAYCVDKGCRNVVTNVNNILCAVPELERAGFYADASTAKYKDDRLVALYLKQEIGGFAIHLLQK